LVNGSFARPARNPPRKAATPTAAAIPSTKPRPPLWKELDVLVAWIEIGLDERGRQLGRRPRRDQELVDAFEPRALLLREIADELTEVGLVAHSKSSSS